MKADDILEIQNLIREKGLDKEREFQEILRIDIEKDTKIWNYYQGIKGKYFKYLGDNGVEYVKIVKLTGNTDKRKVSGVLTDNYSLSFHGRDVYYSEDLSHWLSGIIPGRYDVYQEISESQFLEEITKITEHLEGLKNIIGYEKGNDGF